MFKYSLITLLTICSIAASAQVLVNPKFISGQSNDYVKEMIRDSQGNIYVGYSMDWSSDYLIFDQQFSWSNIPTLTKLNPDGGVVWNSTNLGSVSSIALSENFLYAVNSSYWQNYISKINAANGELLSSFYIPGVTTIVSDKAGRLYVAGNDFVARITSEGTVEWQIDFNPHYTAEAGAQMAIDNDGNLVLAGQFIGGVAFNDFLIDYPWTTVSLYLTRISAAGEVLSADHFGMGGGDLRVGSLKADTDGSIYMTGDFTGSVQFDQTRKLTARGGTDFFLCKLNPERKVDWIRSDGGFGNDTFNEIQLTEKYAYVSGSLSGNVKLDGAQIGFILTPSGMVSRFEKKTGKANWIRAICSIGESESINNSYQLVSHSTNNLLVGGYYLGTLSGDETPSRNFDGFIANVLDTSFHTNGVPVKGKVFAASGANCDPAQTGMANIVVKAMPGSHYTMTDAEGQFKLSLLPGTYTFTQILPQRIGLTITPVCLPTSVKVVDADTPVPAVTFGNKLVLSPYLRIDVATDRLRRCFTNQISLKYTNDGLLAADNVKVDVEFPKDLIVKSASIPWTQVQNNTYTFNLGTVAPGVTSYFTVTDSVRCGDESLRGTTQCVKAVITPFNNVAADPRWDRSDITLKSRCLDNGFLQLVILNSGAGNMADSSAFKIYADDRIALEAKYKLGAGDSLTLQVPANGKTIRLEAYTTNYSAKAMLSISAEGCGGSSQTIVSHGYVNAFPQSDEGAEVEIFCGQVLDSFDPNDKQVFPTGITGQHNIVGDEELEYLIRFQNTGTDVAYNIVIRDELSRYYDLSTLQIGATSHPCVTSIQGEGTPELVWTFKNIMLPDSTSNEPASHGFVKFKVKLLPGIPKGTVITNQAGIYFDFNSPVITNAVFNTIGLPELPRTTLSVQNCSKDVIVEAGPDEEMLICDASSIHLSKVETAGAGRWQTVAGAGVITESGTDVEIKSLATGQNTFTYSVVYCQKSDSRTVSVNRILTPSTPSVANAYNFCSDKLGSAAITLTGNELHWYSDAARSEEITVGTEFKPTRSQILFVTDRSAACESAPAVVKVVVNNAPPAPAAVEAEGCLNAEIPITVAGNNLLWYSSENAATPSYHGNLVVPVFQTAGEQELYVASSMDGCESKRVAIPVKVREFNRNEMFIPNVVTPNDDQTNDTWFLPDSNLEKCAGLFRKVMVYNRFGKVIFMSNDVNFSWNADVPSGVYFYTMTFDAAKFEGSIAVLRGE